MKKYESLHNHTTTSDGELTHLQFLEVAEETGYGVVAFTDHDALPSRENLKQLREYTGPVKWLIGCELSSGLPKELGGGAANMFHMLGLFTDPLDQNLLEYSRQMLAAREERMTKMVANLRRLGFKIEVDDCLEESGGESVGRPHIVKALNRYPENALLNEKLLVEMKKAAQTDARVAEIYAEMLKREPDQYPYFIYLDKKAYIPDVYIDYLYWLDMDKTVDLIRGAGGIAIIAHWPTIRQKVNEELLRKLLTEKRVDGLEFMFGFVSGEEALMEQIVEETGVIGSIGVDAHRQEDLHLFATATERAQKTVGITQKIIDRVKPSLEWSNWNQ